MKRGVIRKAALRSRLARAHALADEPRSVHEPFLPYIRMHRAAGLRLEQAHEMIAAEKHPLCKRIHGQLLVEVLVYV